MNIFPSLGASFLKHFCHRSRLWIREPEGLAYPVPVVRTTAFQRSLISPKSVLSTLNHNDQMEPYLKRSKNDFGEIIYVEGPSGLKDRFSKSLISPKSVLSTLNHNDQMEPYLKRSKNDFGEIIYAEIPPGLKNRFSRSLISPKSVLSTLNHNDQMEPYLKRLKMISEKSSTLRALRA